MIKNNHALRYRYRTDVTKFLLCVVFFSAIVIPLFRMLSHMSMESIKMVIQSQNLGIAIRNSLTSAGVATLITICIAFSLAICMHRIDLRGKTFFEIVFLMPMLIPSISIGMGLVILLGNNGIITQILHLKNGIYGFWGITIGSVMYAFPMAYLMIADIVRYEDSSPYEAAQVLGIPWRKQLAGIMIPYLRKPLLVVAFSVFSMIITDYGVPLMIGGKYDTVATVMYQEVIGQLDFGKGSVVASFLLGPALVAFSIDLLTKDHSNTSFITKTFVPSEKKGVKLIAYLHSGIISSMSLLPVGAFVLLAFTRSYPNDLSVSLENFGKAFDLKVGTYLLNSIIIAVCTAAIGVAVAFITAYFSARMKSRLSRLLHLSAISSAAIPGIVLGLSYVLTFNQTPIYGTIILLVIVNTVHFFASPYLMMYNSLSKMNEHLEAVAQTMAIDRIHMIKDVFIPQCSQTLTEMFSYFFVNCMMTISAVSFLATTANKPAALLISQFEAQMQMECAAVVSLMILTVNLLMKGITYAMRTRLQYRQSQR